MKSEDRKKNSEKILKKFDSWIDSNKVERHKVCISFINNYNFYKTCVIGINNKSDLTEFLNTNKKKTKFSQKIFYVKV